MEDIVVVNPPPDDVKEADLGNQLSPVHEGSTNPDDLVDKGDVESSIAPDDGQNEENGDPLQTGKTVVSISHLVYVLICHVDSCQIAFIHQPIFISRMYLEISLKDDANTFQLLRMKTPSPGLHHL